MADAITSGCIQQLYAAGLRFETELKHALGPADDSVLSRRLLREDWQSPPVRQHSGWVCASLAKAVLSRSNAIRVVRKDEPDGAAIAGWLAGQLPAHQVELLGRSDFLSWGVRAHEGLTSGGIALVHLQALSHSRWALVVGVEWCSGVDPPMQRLPALLLNDVGISPFWGCTHNARLALALPEPQPEGKFSLRTFDGGLLSVEPIGLVVVAPAG